MRHILGLIFFLVVAGLPGFAIAQGSEAQDLCASLDRPNIDCACVAKRIAAYNELSPNAAAVAIIDQGYRYALGKKNTYGESLESAFSDPMAAMGIMTAYEALGGRPENVSDYEEGCVIEGAAKATVTPPRSFPAVDQYIAGCARATGDARFCSCDAKRKSEHLTEAEFEAYYRSFADYSDDAAQSLDELASMRGEAMGMSGTEFQSLQSSARTKLADFEDLDANYCSALLWAE